VQTPVSSPQPSSFLLHRSRKGGCWSMTLSAAFPSSFTPLLVLLGDSPGRPKAVSVSPPGVVLVARSPVAFGRQLRPCPQSNLGGGVFYRERLRAFDGLASIDVGLASGSTVTWFEPGKHNAGRRDRFLHWDIHARESSPTLYPSSQSNRKYYGSSILHCS